MSVRDIEKEGGKRVMIQMCVCVCVRESLMGREKLRSDTGH